MGPGRTCIIVNPRSAGGRTGARLEALRAMADARLGGAEVRATRGAGDGLARAADATREGFECIVAVGGDGTANEVVNGIVSAREEVGSLPSLALLSAGTGCDTVRTLGMPADWDAALALIASAEPRATDLMEGRFATPSGPVVRWGLNGLSFGAGGAVVQRVNRSSKRFGGFATFLGATAQTILSYRPVQVEVSWTAVDGAAGSWEGLVTTGFVSNGQYSGGGMRTGGRASMHDGALDLAIVPALAVSRLVRKVPLLYSGAFRDAEDVVTHRVTRVEVVGVGGSEVVCEIDGEQPGSSPMSLQVHAAALQVYGRWPTV